MTVEVAEFQNGPRWTPHMESKATRGHLFVPVWVICGSGCDLLLGSGSLGRRGLCSVAIYPSLINRAVMWAATIHP